LDETVQYRIHRGSAVDRQRPPFILILAMSNETAIEESSKIGSSETVMDINQIMSILPHRYPFLLVDRVLEIERKQRIVAIKNVTINEPFFQGHFPGYPIMPGVLVVEAIAQAGGLLILTELPDPDNTLMVFTGIDGARFRRPVVPGDQLRIEVTAINWRSRAVKMLGIATVNGKVVCESTATCGLIPRPKRSPMHPTVPEAASE
jgi:3-hydroxyacyl-[acyl-carrier-protein] dehydratase